MANKKRNKKNKKQKTSKSSSVKPIYGQNIIKIQRENTNTTKN